MIVKHRWTGGNNTEKREKSMRDTEKTEDAAQQARKNIHVENELKTMLIGDQER